MKKEAPSRGTGLPQSRSWSLGGQLEERRLLDEDSDSDSLPRRVLPLEPVLPAAVLAPVEAEPADEP